jgi:adhesin/invasin
VDIDIILRQSDASAYSESGGTLSLSSTPPGATFSSLTDNGDGSYSATVGSDIAADYTLSAQIGGVTLATTPAVSFTQVDEANTTVSPAALEVSVADGPETTTLTLRQLDGSLVGHGGHTVTVESTYIDVLSIIPSPTITDNLDGTYTITTTCTIAIGVDDTVSVVVDSVAVGSFTLDCNE